MKKHTIAIVDDHLLIAKAVSGIINQFEDFEVILEAENGKALIEKLSILPSLPEIILLDVSMPIMNGFETAEWLKINHPQILVMALSVQDDDNSLLKMIKNGAKGYIHKNTHPKELENALHSLVTKGMYFQEWAQSKFMMSLSHPTDLGDMMYSKISDREREFLTHVCTEMTYKEIGEKMYCSPRTVEGYRDSLFEKFNIKTRIGLAMLSIKMGINTV